MNRRTSQTSSTRQSVNRGNRRTRGGAGRHNLRTADLKTAHARIRICLGCNRPFKSRGPWNRFCGRCHRPEIEHENTTRHRIPREWPRSYLSDIDDI